MPSGRAQALETYARDRDAFPVRFTGANKALLVLGASPATAYVDITQSELSVRFAFWFRSGCAARRSARSPSTTGVCGVGGAHGWRGEWLINGSSSGIVRVDSIRRAAPG